MKEERDLKEELLKLEAQAKATVEETETEKTELQENIRPNLKKRLVTKADVIEKNVVSEDLLAKTDTVTVRTNDENMSIAFIKKDWELIIFTIQWIRITTYSSSSSSGTQVAFCLLQVLENRASSSSSSKTRPESPTMSLSALNLEQKLFPLMKKTSNSRSGTLQAKRTSGLSRVHTTEAPSEPSLSTISPGKNHNIQERHLQPR